jgi:hypothetical protein
MVSETVSPRNAARSTSSTVKRGIWISSGTGKAHSEIFLSASAVCFERTDSTSRTSRQP